MARSRHALVARGVRKSFPGPAGNVDVLRGVDLTLERGAFLAVTGTSGSGKTTLLHCLAGLDRIDRGQVAVEGTDLTTLSDRALSAWRARRLGVVFQQANLVSVLSAVENVELPLLLAGERPGAARRRALDALDRVGLADRAPHVPAALSGGEQQRVAVARAVVAEPAVVWADEPTGALDRATADEVLAVLGQLHRAGATLVVVTHDPVVAAAAQRRVELTEGVLRPATRRTAVPA